MNGKLVKTGHMVCIYSCNERENSLASSAFSFLLSWALLFPEGTNSIWCNSLKFDVVSWKRPKHSMGSIGIPLIAFKHWTQDILSNHQSRDCFEMQIKFVLPILDYWAEDCRVRVKCIQNSCLLFCFSWKENVLCATEISKICSEPKWACLTKSLVSERRFV